MDKLHDKHDYEENPIGLPDNVAQTIAPELDAHVCSLFTLFHQYQKHHWVVEGPQFRDLHLYLEQAYLQIHKNLDAIAERMTVLGAFPTASPSALEHGAYIHHEEEGVYPIRTMLANDRSGEKEIARRMRQTIKLANDQGDYGTKALLEKVLIEVEDRAHHLDHYLGSDSLEKADALSYKG